MFPLKKCILYVLAASRIMICYGDVSIIDFDYTSIQVMRCNEQQNANCIRRVLN